MEQVVYFIGTQDAVPLQAVQAALEHVAVASSPVVSRGVHFQVENSVPRVLAKLRARRADALVVDTRFDGAFSPDAPSVKLIHTMFREHDIGEPIGREHTLMVVNPDSQGTAFAFDAGRVRIGGVVPAPQSDEGWRSIWQRLEKNIHRSQGGRVALCLAGGGIEGLFYELGVLRALQYFLPEYNIQDVDILCGISAGSIIGAFMANGMSMDEIVRGMQFGEGTLDKIERTDIFDPNVGELVRRLGSGAMSVLRGKANPVQSFFRLAPSGAFAGNGLRKYLAKQLAKPGMTDDFRQLKHEYFVGATDQDTSEHVVFGSPGWDHVPIHQAVRASSALAPFYAPEEIEGRYYIDGAFTRTTNVRVAVENKATMVILLDPLVPIHTDRPGYVASKGGLMVSMQGIKSLIQGRFGRAVHMLRTMYPHIAFHLFQPDGATMRVMAGSPMKFFYRTEIEEIAYRETLRSIRQERFENLQHDFARHGIAFVDPEADIGSIKRDLLDEASEIQVA